MNPVLPLGYRRWAQRAAGETAGARRRGVGHAPTDEPGSGAEPEGVASILRTLFLSRAEFEALPESERRARMVDVLVATGWSRSDAGAAVAGFGAGELLERTAAAMGHAPEAAPPPPPPPPPPPSAPHGAGVGRTVAELLLIMGTDRAGWDALGASDQRAKAVALLRNGGFSESEATARVASYGDGEILERVAADIAARLSRLSPRTRDAIDTLATGPKKASRGGKLVIGVILARILFA